ncbi:hypothetical protein ACTHQ8_13710 [Lysinibacillus odysseyi]|uniref:hypothetical protein n=1 Tax=Lysinibacillus odysseyi TaxID=202611 RepID=UPI0014701888|nr:hypothetical protein [Lysinibacillus odysseyi]
MEQSACDNALCSRNPLLDCGFFVGEYNVILVAGGGLAFLPENSVWKIMNLIGVFV